MNKTWLELRINVPAAAIDLVCNELAELGCEGVTVEERPLDTFVVPDPDQDAPAQYYIKSYFADRATPGELRRQVEEMLHWLAPMVPGLETTVPEIGAVANEDWAEGWKQHFSAVAIGSRLVIKPSWEDYSPTPHQVVVNLDPGMAFGTGTHGTTRLCLEAVAALYEAPPGPQRILDVGTGSGILAIAAAALGAPRVLACDIDPEACRTAAENAQLNGVSGAIEITDQPLESLEGGFEVVVANILAEENIRLATELLNRLLPGGTLILSGILREKEEMVKEAFAAFDLGPPETTRLDEWICITYRKSM